MKMNIEVKVINSFSINGIGGNPAGVLLDADRLTTEQKQLVAFKAGLSEVAFLSDSSVAEYKVEFFTPSKQIPHCGHATVAAFSYLKSIGKIRGDLSSKETIDGIRQILLERDCAYMQQSPAKFLSVPDENAVLESLGISNNLLDDALPIKVGNTGNSFLLVPIRDEINLVHIKPDLQKIQQISEELACVGYYVFARTADEFDAQARMFAPAYGISEESATGMAAGPLASMLASYGANRKTTYIIGQGKYMTPPSASRITVNIDPISGSIMAGGNAYVNRTIGIEI
jgi:PhzF family phenazine biosynthesis protein